MHLPCFPDWIEYDKISILKNGKIKSMQFFRENIKEFQFWGLSFDFFIEFFYDFGFYFESEYLSTFNVRNSPNLIHTFFHQQNKLLRKFQC